MQNLNQGTKEALLSQMGEEFKTWADEYFSKDNNKLDILIVREKAFEDFIKETDKVRWTTNKWINALKAYCTYNGYTYNPKEHCCIQDQISQKIDGKNFEMIFISSDIKDVPPTRQEKYQQQAEKLRNMLISKPFVSFTISAVLTTVDNDVSGFEGKLKDTEGEEYEVVFDEKGRVQQSVHVKGSGSIYPSLFNRIELI